MVSASSGTLRTIAGNERLRYTSQMTPHAKSVAGNELLQHSSQETLGKLSAYSMRCRQALIACDCAQDTLDPKRNGHDSVGKAIWPKKKIGGDFHHQRLYL
jgi:hypothetical protein